MLLKLQRNGWRFSWLHEQASEQGANRRFCFGGQSGSRSLIFSCCCCAVEGWRCGIVEIGGGRFGGKRVTDEKATDETTKSCNKKKGESNGGSRMGRERTGAGASTGKQTCFVQQQRVSSAVPLGSLLWSPSCCRIIRGDIFPPGRASSSKLLLLPRISERVLSRTPNDRTPNAKSSGDCRGRKWICQHQEQRLAKHGVKATATISAGRRNIISGRRQSTSRRPEGSGGFNVDLELEILAFMLQSGKSDAFPSKEELIAAGRWDLVEAIVTEGGWLASGWEKKANASIFGGVMPETAHRSLSGKRAAGSKSKAVRSPRRSRGRPKLVGRRSSSITASPGENSEPGEPEDVISGQTEDPKINSPPENQEPGEPQKDVISGQTEDPKIDSPRVERDNGAAILEPAASPSFERVRKERGSRFPSNSAGYRLWEFESLADFIEYRKLDAKNRSGQRRQISFCSNSSVRRKRFEPEAAKRRSEVCERRCEAASELRRQVSRCYEETDVKKDLGTASPLEQDTRVDEALNVKAELDTVLTVHQYPRVDVAVNYEADGRGAIIIEQGTRVDGAMSPEAELDTASWGEGVDSKQYARVDEAVNSQADVRNATIIEQDTRVDGEMSPEAELDTASSGEGVDSKQYPRVDEAVNSEADVRNETIIEQDTRVDGAMSPEAELDTASPGEAVDGKHGRDIKHIQASVIAPEADVPSAAEKDSSAQEASSQYEHVAESSTGGQGMRGPIVETQGKVKKKKKKRKKVNIKKTEDVSKTPEELSEALDWINQMVDRRERWMQEAKSRSLEGPSEKPKSIQDRIRSLEDRLAVARTGLLSGREALGQKGDAQEQSNSPSDEHTRRLAALRDASDELEYTENKILKISNELTTTRREVAALEGAHGTDIMDICHAAGENEKKTEIARTGLQSLRTARIVWPHPAREVLLIGSFDGWNEKIKMELSGAGVFVVSLPLPPGRYEIKFIVDGTWRVDTGRTIIYVGGYENNVLIIPEQFTLDLRR